MSLWYHCLPEISPNCQYWSHRHGRDFPLQPRTDRAPLFLKLHFQKDYALINIMIIFHFWNCPIFFEVMMVMSWPRVGRWQSCSCLSDSPKPLERSRELLSENCFDHKIIMVTSTGSFCGHLASSIDKIYWYFWPKFPYYSLYTHLDSFYSFECHNNLGSHPWFFLMPKRMISFIW